MRRKIKALLFGLVGKDPEAVVVSFATGTPEQADRMIGEIRQLVPDRRHFTVRLGAGEAAHPEDVVLADGTVWSLFLQLRRRFRRMRVGIAPVLFGGDAQYRRLRTAVFLFAPGKILAYNARLERQHVRLRSLITSVLFLRGMPLDRARLRPWWLAPWRAGRAPQPASWKTVQGRPFLPERRRVAVLAPYFPYPLAHGGAVRMYHLLREIAREYDVVLFSFTDGEGEICEPLLEFCSRVFLVPRPQYYEPRWSTLTPPEAAEVRSETMQKLWDGFSRELGVEARQVEYTQMASYGGDVLVAHDLNQDLYGQILARERTWGAGWNFWRWKRYERGAFRNYSRVVVMSERDAAMIAGVPAKVVPNGVDLDRFRPEEEESGERLLFIGSFRHFPNAIAWQFFADRVWPFVRERFPGATVTVVAGPDPLEHWRAATGALGLPADPRFRMLAFVRDVRPLYAEANLVVVPTLASAGTNLKTLEAMAMKRAIVATPSGCKGLGLRHGESAWIAGDERGLAEGITELLAQPGLRRRLAEEARRIAEERFGWDRIGEAAREVLREVMEVPLMVRPASKDDVPELDRIQRASREAVLWEPHGYLSYDCRVAMQGAKVAGFVVCRMIAPDESEVLSLVVDPAMRRRGIGLRLMREVLDHKPGMWYLEVRESNSPARNLYKKLGFEDISLRPSYYQDTGETAVVMRLKPC